MLVPFPIACFVGAFACDIAYWYSANALWVTGSVWLLGAGLVMALLTAAVGLIDATGDPRIRELSTVWWHASANVLVVVIEAVNGFLRYQQGATAVLPTGFTLSLIAVAVLLFSGWMGGKLVFEGGVGVANKLD
jgi:uncharacterized membrane protein